MKIKVFTKHYIPVKAATEVTAMVVHYDYDEEFIFIYENNLVKLNDGVWCHPANNLEQCFQAITAYFKTGNYHIKDMIQMPV